jgi:hypothetical protein
MRAAALTVLLLALCAGRVSAQALTDTLGVKQRHVEVPSNPDAFMDWALTIRVQDTHWGAFTTCGAFPVVWPRGDLSPADTGNIGVHERDHVEVMAGFPTCRDFYVWKYADPQNEVMVEARAYCAGARYDWQTGRYPSLDAAVRAAASVLVLYWPHPWDFHRAYKAIKHYGCA